MSFITSQCQCSINVATMLLPSALLLSWEVTNASQIFAGNMKAKTDDLKQ